MNYISFCSTFFLLLLLFSYKTQASEYQIFISKSNRELIVKKENQVIKHFNIAVGKGGRGTKIQQGDNKTPVGKYYVIDFKKSDAFFYFIQLNYPNLFDAWYGYKNNIINADEFKEITMAYKNNEKPPQNTNLGGYIGIHGIGETNREKINIHQIWDWTKGCIAITNEEIIDIKKYVTIGMPVTIID